MSADWKHRKAAFKDRPHLKTGGQTAGQLLMQTTVSHYQAFYFILLWSMKVFLCPGTVVEKAVRTSLCHFQGWATHTYECQDSAGFSFQPGGED